MTEEQLKIFAMIVIGSIGVISSIIYYVIHPHKGKQDKRVYKIFYLPKENIWEAKYINDPSPIPISSGKTFEEAKLGLDRYIDRNKKSSEYYYDANGNICPAKTEKK